MSKKQSKQAADGIGLPAQARARVVDVLNPLLADTVVLYIKTRNFHWNVTGPQFLELHKLFEIQYEALAATMDEIAERIRALDGIAAGSLTDYRQLMRLPEASGHLPAAQMLTALLADHEAMARHLRAAVTVAADAGDRGTEDFLTGLLEGYEKSAWMLRATLR